MEGVKPENVEIPKYKKLFEWSGSSFTENAEIQDITDFADKRFLRGLGWTGIGLENYSAFLELREAKPVEWREGDPNIPSNILARYESPLLAETKIYYFKTDRYLCIEYFWLDEQVREGTTKRHVRYTITYKIELWEKVS